MDEVGEEERERVDFVVDDAAAFFWMPRRRVDDADRRAKADIMMILLFAIFIQDRLEQ